VHECGPWVRGGDPDPRALVIETAAPGSHSRPDEPPSPERTTRAPLDPSSARRESLTGFPNPQDPPRPTAITM